MLGLCWVCVRFVPGLCWGCARFVLGLCWGCAPPSPSNSIRGNKGAGAGVGARAGEEAGAGAGAGAGSAAGLSQNSWQRLLGDLADSWCVRADLLGTIFSTILGPFRHHFGTFGRHFGTQGPLEHTCRTKVAKKAQGGSPLLLDPIWEPVFAHFRPRGRFF